jgi:hypothetical protein
MRAGSSGLGAASSPATGCRRDGINDFGGTQDTPDGNETTCLASRRLTVAAHGRRQCLGGFTPHFS